MHKKRIVIQRVVFTCLGLALPLFSSAGYGQVSLKFKFPDGRTSSNVTDVKSLQTLTIAGMEIVTKSSQKLTVNTVNGTRSADGVLKVQHSIDALRADLDFNGQKLGFDSANPDAPRPGTALDGALDVFKALSQSKWTATRDADDRVTDMSGRSDALKSLPEAARKSTERQFDPVYLTQQANDEMAVIPDHPVKKGDTWDLKTTLRLEAGQTLTFEKTYTYEGTVQVDGRELHRISESTKKIAYDMDASSPSPLKYISSELTVADSAGATLFDARAGQIQKSDSKINIKGSIVFEANNMPLPATLDLTLSTTHRLVRP